MQKLLLYICMVLVCTRCAQITPLTGGKKDTDPPKLIKAIPENASLNVTSKTIELQFDEYITLKDVNNQFIITPQTKNFPDIQASGKKVKIKFDEDLLPNTTYKLSFGNAIVDLRESNNLPNFEYVFSTGNTIDSLKLKGQIIKSTDHKPTGQVLVGLYPENAEDSIIYKDKPLYLIRTNDQGQFSFNYLPAKKFKIVGIADRNKNLLYDGSEEHVAYRDKPADPTDTADINMILFKEIPYKSFIKKTVSLEYGKVNVIYNKPQTTVKEIKAKGLILHTWNKTGDTLSLYYTNTYDTLETVISYTSAKTDTLYIKIPGRYLKNDKQPVAKVYKYLLNTKLDNAVPYFSSPKFALNFPVESKNIDADKMKLTEKEDTARAVIKPFKILTEQDAAASFTLQTEFKPGANYTLTIPKSAINDGPQRINDSTTYMFKTNTPDDYAQLTLKLLFPKKENYIVILQNDKGELANETIFELSLTSPAEKFVTYKNLLPGNYVVKVIEDANKNGMFDTGNYFLHTQPETIFVNNAPIKLLAGWEIENEWLIKQ